MPMKSKARSRRTALRAYRYADKAYRCADVFAHFVGCYTPSSRFAPVFGVFSRLRRIAMPMRGGSYPQSHLIVSLCRWPQAYRYADALVWHNETWRIAMPTPWCGSSLKGWKNSEGLGLDPLLGSLSDYITYDKKRLSYIINE